MRRARCRHWGAAPVPRACAAPARPLTSESYGTRAGAYRGWPTGVARRVREHCLLLLKLESIVEGPALQDALKVHCFGCGALNERGLQIKSHWDGDELVCRWLPNPYHIGHPGIVYGGLIASVVDCHAIWTAMATACRDEGVPLDEASPPPFAFVTGKLSVSYLNPARIDRPLEL